MLAGAGFPVHLLPRPTRRRCSRSPCGTSGGGRRDDHREPQPARGQRLQAVPGRWRADRAAGGRGDRGGHPGRARCAGPGSAPDGPLVTGTAPRWPRPTWTRVAASAALRGRRPRPACASSTRRCMAWPAASRCGPSPRRLPPPHVVAPRRSPTPISRRSRSPTPRSPAPSTCRWLGRTRRADLVARERPGRRPARRRGPRPGRGRRLAGADRRPDRPRSSARYLLDRGRRAAPPGDGSWPRPWSRPRCSGASPRPHGARYAETLTGFKWIVRAGHGLREPLRVRLRGGARLRGRRRGPRQGRHRRGARRGRPWPRPPRRPGRASWTAGRHWRAALGGRLTRRRHRARARPAARTSRPAARRGRVATLGEHPVGQVAR